MARKTKAQIKYYEEARRIEREAALEAELAAFAETYFHNLMKQIFRARRFRLEVRSVRKWNPEFTKSVEYIEVHNHENQNPNKSFLFTEEVTEENRDMLEELTWHLDSLEEAQNAYQEKVMKIDALKRKFESMFSEEEQELLKDQWVES